MEKPVSVKTPNWKKKISRDICGNDWLSICKMKTKFNLNPLCIYLYAYICICVSTCTHNSRQTTDINLCTQIINLLEENVNELFYDLVGRGRFPQIQKAVIIREKKCPQFENCSLKHIFSKADWKLKDIFARFRVNKELVFQMHEELPRASDTEISGKYLKGWSGVSHKILMEANKGVRGHLVLLLRGRCCWNHGDAATSPPVRMMEM